LYHFRDEARYWSSDYMQISTKTRKSAVQGSIPTCPSPAFANFGVYPE